MNPELDKLDSLLRDYTEERNRTVEQHFRSNGQWEEREKVLEYVATEALLNDLAEFNSDAVEEAFPEMRQDQAAVLHLVRNQERQTAAAPATFLSSVMELFRLPTFQLAALASAVALVAAVLVRQGKDVEIVNVPPATNSAPAFTVQFAMFSINRGPDGPTRTVKPDANPVLDLKLNGSAITLVLTNGVFLSGTITAASETNLQFNASGTNVANLEASLSGQFTGNGFDPAASTSAFGLQSVTNAAIEATLTINGTATKLNLGMLPRTEEQSP